LSKVFLIIGDYSRRVSHRAIEDRNRVCKSGEKRGRLDPTIDLALSGQT